MFLETLAAIRSHRGPAITEIGLPDLRGWPHL